MEHKIIIPANKQPEKDNKSDYQRRHRVRCKHHDDQIKICNIKNGPCTGCYKCESYEETLIKFVTHLDALR